MNPTITKASKLLLAGLITAFILVVGIVGLASWSHSSSPVDLGKVRAVSQAGSVEEVENLLGKPSRVVKRDENNTPATWTYRHRLKWYEFKVAFAPDGRVLGCWFED
jgi:hypothetical protein